MPGPYTFPTDRVVGGPDPAGDVNALAAALNEADDAALANVLMLRDANGRAKVADALADEDIVNKGFMNEALLALISALQTGAPYQWIPPVGSTFTSAFYLSLTTSTLRDRSTAPMPLLLNETISIDQASFNLTVLATTAGQTAQMDLMELIDGVWTLVQNLADDIPLAAPATIGIKTVSFSPVELGAGIVYGIRLFENQAFDAALRVSQGTMNGPGIGPIASFTTGWNLPINANAATVTGVPMIRVRRSA